MYSNRVLLHHAPFIVPAHGTWPGQVFTQGFSTRTRAPWCAHFCVWHAVGSVNVCWMQVLRVVSLLVCSLFEERGVFWKGASCQGRRSYLEKGLILWEESMLAKYSQAKISLIYSPWVSYMCVTLGWIFFHLTLNLVLGVMRWVTLSVPLHPHPDSPDFIVTPGPSCIFLPSCKIQEMFVLWGK